MIIKKQISRLLSITIACSLLLGGFHNGINAQGEGTTFTVNIADDTGLENKVQYHFGDADNWLNVSHATPIDISGQTDITVRLTKSEGVKAQATSTSWSDCMGTDSTNGQRFDLQDGESYTLNVNFTNDAGGGNPGSGGNPPIINNPIDITVNIAEGLDYLDTQGSCIKIDEIEVVNNHVTVEKGATHVISILPQFGYAINAEINGTKVTGTESEGWCSYTVEEADTYTIKISKAGSSVNTVTWALDDKFGEDGKVSNGTVKIISATLPDGSNGILNMDAQDENGGLVAIIPGSTVKVEIKPDYGYQFVAGSLNGNTVTAGTDVSTFTFTMPSTNLHLSALFTKTDDIINVDSTQVASGSISNGGNIVDSGNLKLEIKDLAQNEIQEIDNSMKQTAGDDEIKLYLDMNLFSVINKGTQTDVWENKLTDLSGDLTVSLNLDESLRDIDGTFYVIRSHDEADGTKSYTKIKAIYNKEAGTVTFATNKFSTYALVLEKDAVSSSVGVNVPKTGDNSNVTLWIGVLAISLGGVIGLTAYNKKKRYSIR